MVAPIANLFDDFDDGSIDPAKWVTTGGAYTEANGNICGTVPGSDSLESVAAWSLTQSSAFVEVAAFTNGAGATAGKNHFEMFSTADPTDDVYIEVDAFANTIKYARQNNGVDVDTLTEAYNATTMRWWRIREFSSFIRFETSPNGNDWTTQFSTATQSWTGSVKVFLFVSQTGGAAIAKCWDNFNIASASGRAVSVGSEFEVTDDGALRLERCDQVDAAWPFACPVGAYNALRKSLDPCGLWVQPPAKQLVSVEAVVTSTSAQDETTLITLELTNPDTCRVMLFYLPLTAGMKMVITNTEAEESVSNIFNWTLGVQVSGVDNPDSGFTPVTANDFGASVMTHLWRGEADYFWTADPGATTTIEVKLKVFAGGGDAKLTQLQARMGIIGMSAMEA